MPNINEIKTTLLNLPYAMREELLHALEHSLDENAPISAAQLAQDLSVVRKRLASLESGESLEYSWEQVRDRLSNLH